MTPWQKFKEVSWETCKDCWILPFLIPMYVADEFNTKLKPPVPIAVLVFVIGVVLTSLLFAPGLLFWVAVIILRIIYVICTNTYNGFVNWIKRINSNDYI